MVTLKDSGWEILFELRCEVGGSEEVVGLAAASQGAEAEILVGEGYLRNCVKRSLHSTAASSVQAGYTEMTVMGSNNQVPLITAISFPFSFKKQKIAVLSKR